MSMQTEPIDRSFFQRPVLEVAKALIGMLLVRDDGNNRLIGRIVETEAYGGLTDPSAHSYKGVTGRCFAMFGPAGQSYVYSSQGACHCLNLVAEGSSKGRGVLIRAIEPLTGIETMRARRVKRTATAATIPVHQLANGPGKLCLCFELNRSHNFLDVCSKSSGLYVARGTPPQSVSWTRRIGLSSKNPSHKWLWRCSDTYSPAVGKPEHTATALLPEPAQCASPEPERVKRARVDSLVFFNWSDRSGSDATATATVVTATSTASKTLRTL
eukprot:TRINITY_DN1715_c1_g3_i2.p1 TRINITY_DN1715_c1_g3~~TRINITY_DN1715_c1_g3_i2.p1  ORF type:complete len:270 (+),score=16.87 TRINITY_DN1715_c1_g3_i2:95-904(+)